MTTKTVKLGLCGAGRWGKRYLHTIKDSPRFKIQALYSRNPESQSLIPSDSFITSDWKDLAKRRDLDGVIVATPASTHIEIAKAMISQGIPCMIEKPLSTSLEECRSFGEFVSTQNVPVFVDYTMLFHPAYTELKKRLQGESIIEIRSEGSNWGPFRPDCSALWDYGSHDLAFCVDLKGGAPEQIKARKFSSEKADHGSRFELDLKWGDGSIARIVSSNIENKKTRVLEVYTKTQKFTFDDLSETPLTAESDQGHQIISVPPKRPLACALEFFGDAIERQIQINHSWLGLGFALSVTKVLDRAQRAC